ncbi:MAG TPA: M48 family metalloprotease [Candidatus Acidoferrales bacterium]|nr:M48 family metalloprotease [Candidatus Acidoferrales bacterium]
MSNLLRRTLTVFLSELLIFLPAGVGGSSHQASAEKSAVEPDSLRSLLQKPYLELFELSPRLEFSEREIEAQRKSLESGKKLCVTRFKGHVKTYGKRIDALQKDLKKNTTKITEDGRKQAHCTIQNLELVKAEAQVLSGQAIPTAYDNLNAKLDIIQKWPSLYRQTQQEIASGAYNQRRWGDVKDIGFREIAAGQQDDIKKGQQAIEELKRSGMLPPEVEDKKIQEYVNSVAQRVAQHSDLKVPLHVSVLQSREVNAFALPGGYMFIERGLLEAADDESELAGVIAHEIAHDTARHSNKMMKRATIAGIFYQAAQIAAIVLTGGVAGIGMYYALQYGFYGLGLVLDLKLLGVSRDYELEADQLGVQYAWNTGYDPTGFTRFFDKMATKEGYVNGVSWFRTHPPFYTRMVETQREIMFLPKKDGLVVQTAAFEQMKKELAPIASAAEKEEVGKPSLLLQREQGCEAPKKLEYKPGEPIEDLCARPPVTVPNTK